MGLSPDTEEVLQSTAALINSAHEPDTLTTTAELRAYFVDHRFTGSHRGDEAELASVRRVRPELESLWSQDEQAVVSQLNRLLMKYRALPQVVRHGDVGWHIHATDDTAPFAERVAVEAAMALVDVVRAQELSRLRRCADPDCENVLVDLSRNRSRRFCDAGCGNRANVAAYRARKGQG